MGAKLRRLGVGLRELVPGPRSIPRMAKRVGYFVLIYFGVLVLAILSLVILGITGFAGVLGMIPLAVFIAFQGSRAATKADEYDNRTDNTDMMSVPGNRRRRSR